MNLRNCDEKLLTPRKLVITLYLELNSLIHKKYLPETLLVRFVFGIILILPFFFRNSSAFISFLERTSAPKISNCRGARTNISVSSVTKFCILAPFFIASSIASSLFIEHNVPVNTTFLFFRLFIVIYLFTSYMTSTRGHVLHTLRQCLVCLLVVSTCPLEACGLRVLNWLLWCWLYLLRCLWSLI